ncbi:UDP-N-acetylmuramoyl-tripeptide--D-alanyl-D-alanine ligase [Bacillaceae bacterium Marseille-Q3522]|nr:UDP-N-acetylmuramoyl-tripeptide--D-alanyl-D-alanine ligase [Bacillaceae bacterium Marseille-Q3522]
MMKTLSLSDVLQAVDGTLLKGDKGLTIQRITRHMKSLHENTLYFHRSKKAIAPDFFVGKKMFIFVTEDPSMAKDVDQTACVIHVKNAKEAYLNVIDYYRSLFNIPIIGVTGTCGKTTTKDMIRHILIKDKKVHSTYLSQNGLHLNLHYLTGINEKTEVGVFEMGVAYPGNIRVSGRFFKPTIGVITNIGEAHLEGCGTLEKYIRAKGEMLEVVSQEGILIINKDDKNIKKLPLTSFKGKILSFGLHEQADFRATNMLYANDGMMYTLHFAGNHYEVYTPGYGEHNVYNSLAAITSAHTVGVSIENAIRRLRTFKTIARHTKIYKGFNGSTVIDDTWSCNPSSVKAGMEVLKNTSKGNKEVLVLGKMQRLGRQLKDQHIKMGKIIMDFGGVDYLITIGTSAALTGQQAMKSGLDPEKFIPVSNANELESVLDNLSKENMAILFKMSLGKMDPSYRRVVEKYRHLLN